MKDHIHHKQSGPDSLICGVITISDTRTTDNDEGGAYISDSLSSMGHEVRDRIIIKDDPDEIKKIVKEYTSSKTLHLLITTGGTGIASRDNTIDTIKPLFDKTMNGFGELFRSLSYEEVGARAMLSNAVGGSIGNTMIFCLPGSFNAVKLGMDKLILPDLGHLVWEINR